MSGRTKGLIATAFVCVLGLAAYTLMPGSMHTAPADTAATDIVRPFGSNLNPAREPAPDSRSDASRSDASMSAALDAVRESLQRHDMESARVLLAAILALHRDNPDALALRNRLKAGESRDMPAAPVTRTSTPPAKVADTRHRPAVVAANSHNTSRTGRRSDTHEDVARTSKKAPVVANKTMTSPKVATAKANLPRPSAVQKPQATVREAQVRQVRPDAPTSPQRSAPRTVLTASGAPLVSNGTQQAPSTDQDGSGGASKPERWRDRGGMR